MLRHGKQVASPAEIEAAALQFVRKVSGFRRPSRRNEEAFAAAVGEVSAACRRLLGAISANTDHA